MKTQSEQSQRQEIIMETLMASDGNEEPTPPERTEAERIAQYRIDYPATLKSVADVLVAKVNA